MAGRASKEIVVFELLSRDSACSDCNEDLGKGGLLVKEGEKGLCLSCADLDHLVFLPSGDTALTRRAGKYTGARIVVVKFSRARRRYERQGILVTEEALGKAEQECLDDADARARARARAAMQRTLIDREYVGEFARHVREMYPQCPAGEETMIAEHACRKYSGRVGRSAGAKEFMAKKIKLAVQAHIRHRHTDYDEILFSTSDRSHARASVRHAVDDTLAAWSGR
jgi:hypothetical protein